jgi:hypothetical protein
MHMPETQKGWVSEAGNTLQFDKNNEAVSFVRMISRSIY